jgi:hypothetical protein
LLDSLVLLIVRYNQDHLPIPCAPTSTTNVEFAVINGITMVNGKRHMGWVLLLLTAWQRDL